MKKSIPLFFGIIGFLDSAYLSYERFAHLIIPCSGGIFFDCGKVLSSPYATPLGVPLSVIGMIHYFVLILIALAAWKWHKPVLVRLLFILSAIGLVASLFFIYLQLVVIGAICLYCMLSAVNSIFAFFAIRIIYAPQYRQWLVWLIAIKYKYILKRLLFLFPPEAVHTFMVSTGELLGHLPILKHAVGSILRKKYPNLVQRIGKLEFHTPVGLAAGFDYEARLTGILPYLGFGFQSVGTITNLPYAGNEKPRLGRLPKSRSLMVNKGFKNLGVKATIQRLARARFHNPVGISIGQTNTEDLTSLESVIVDIVTAFRLVEKAKLNIGYYELNISCPNLKSGISFYPPKHLDALLRVMDALHLKKPLFIKMPIDKTDTEFLALLKVITKHDVTGIIVGNLQKDRHHPGLDKTEVAQWPVGNFSGKPTEQRSNELIELTYRAYGKKLVIIGCGGIFSAQDAYSKIKKGATLVQLITGMIFQGPQLIAQINEGLHDLVLADGYDNIKEAIGADCDSH